MVWVRFLCLSPSSAGILTLSRVYTLFWREYQRGYERSRNHYTRGWEERAFSDDALRWLVLIECLALCSQYVFVCFLLLLIPCLKRRANDGASVAFCSPTFHVSDKHTKYIPDAWKRCVSQRLVHLSVDSCNFLLLILRHFICLSFFPPSIHSFIPLIHSQSLLALFKWCVSLFLGILIMQANHEVHPVSGAAGVN